MVAAGQQRRADNTASHSSVVEDKCFFICVLFTARIASVCSHWDPRRLVHPGPTASSPIFLFHSAIRLQHSQIVSTLFLPEPTSARDYYPLSVISETRSNRPTPPIPSIASHRRDLEASDQIFLPTTTWEAWPPALLACWPSSEPHHGDKPTTTTFSFLSSGQIHLVPLRRA